jgi:hypothetical protein
LLVLPAASAVVGRCDVDSVDAGFDAPELLFCSED